MQVNQDSTTLFRRRCVNTFRRLQDRPKLTIFLGILLIIWMCYASYLSYLRNIPYTFSFGTPPPNSIKLAVSACGDNIEFLNQVFVLLKSTVLLTKSHVHFILIADCSAPTLNYELQNWPEDIKSRISYEIIHVSYPGIPPKEQIFWREMFRSCSTERLFIPKIFPNLDSVIYLDADTLILDDIQNLWDQFKLMDENQVIGIAEEFYHPTEPIGWGYGAQRDSRVPIVGKTGVNAGVLLMNLTRMREFGFFERIMPIYKEYERFGIYADQGVINVMFHFNPDKLYKLPCRWNFWDGHCMKPEFCPSAKENGVGLMHHTGFNGYWDICLHVVYRSFLDFEFGEDLKMKLLMRMEEGLKNVEDISKCTNNTWLFYKGLSKLIV